MQKISQTVSRPSRSFATALVMGLGLAILLTGCSNFTRSNAPDNTAMSDSAQSFLQDGSISVARPFPQPLSAELLAQPEFKAFLPPISYQGAWISVNKESGKIALMSGDSEAQSFQAEGVASIAAGDYTVVHKQRNPLWYASDDYFTKRQLSVPPEGDRGRFRRGALGSFAVFLTKDLPIHCGPIWSDEIGGIQMSEADLSKLYYMINLGAPIKVQ